MVSDNEPRYRLLDSSGTVVGTIYERTDGALALQEASSENEIALQPNGDITAVGSVLRRLGHDEVDVPQTRNLTVADFEGGVLPQDSVGDTADATVQSSVALEGEFSLEISRSSSGFSLVGFADRDTTIQFGDSFEILTRLTDAEDNARINILSSDPSERRFNTTTLSILISAEFDALRYDTFVGGSKVDDGGVSQVDVSNHLNETLSLTGNITTEGTVSLILSDNTGSELGTVSFTLPSGFPESGNVQFMAVNDVLGATVYFDGLFVERRVGEYYSETQNGTVELGNDVQPSGAIDAGPQEAIVSDSTVHGILRSDDALSAGADVEVVEWDAGVGRRSLKAQADGNGGVVGLRDSLAAQLTSDLSFERESLADADKFVTQSEGGSLTAQLTGFPRRLELTHDGSSSSNIEIGVGTPVLVTQDSLGPFRINFHNVSFTDAGTSFAFLGLTDNAPNAIHTADGASIGIEPQLDVLYAEDSNSNRDINQPFSSALDFSTNPTLSIEYDGSQLRALVDGVVQAEGTTDVSGPLSPVITLRDSGSSSASETLSVEQITVEEL